MRNEEIYRAIQKMNEPHKVMLDNVVKIISALTLAGIIWLGSNMISVRETIIEFSFRIDQIEKKLTEIENK